MPVFSGRCRSTRRLEGQTAVVTGSNTGIGKETAMDLYKRGARVIMACRDTSKAMSAQQDIQKKCSAESQAVGELLVTSLDLGSLSSVRRCAQHLLDTEKQINILINNAGVMMCPQGKTEDGFETQFGTNHLGHFLFTLLLLPRIISSAPSRIVNVSSLAHQLSKMDFDDLNTERKPYKPIPVYAQSKLANILFTKELAKKLQEHGISGVTVYSLHPGVIRTELGRHLDSAIFPGARLGFNKLLGLFIKSPHLGAQTNIYCAVDEKCANETGLYYSDCAAVRPGKGARDPEAAARLWEVSCEMVGLQNHQPFLVEQTKTTTRV